MIIMLNNSFNSFKLKNFFKTGMYLDFFLKKKINKKLLKITSLNTFFLEKTVLEDIFLQIYMVLYVYIFIHVGSLFLKKNFLINFIKIFIIMAHFYFLFIYL